MAKARTIKIHDAHFTVVGSLEPDAEGWYFSACNCGYGPAGPFPGPEDAADDLMQHAREMGYMQARDDAAREGDRTT